jgi:hypothetical protein
MKTTIYMFFTSLLFCAMSVNAQCQIHIDTISFCYFNSITEQNQIIDIYKIRNNSNEDYLTWVSLAPINNRTNIELMHDFFKQRKGDFNFMEMVYENLLDAQRISIGYSFIKNITAGKTFSYIIAKTNTDSILYKNRIIVISKEEVERYLKMKIDEKYFFQSSSIVLTEKEFIKEE